MSYDKGTKLTLTPGLDLDWFAPYGTIQDKGVVGQAAVVMGKVMLMSMGINPAVICPSLLRYSANPKILHSSDFGGGPTALAISPNF